MTNPMIGYQVMQRTIVGSVGQAYNYELAGNGVWVWAIGPHIWARVPVADAKVRGLSEMEILFSIQHGPIPARLFDLAYSVFLAAPETERFVAIVWDAPNSRYRLECPPQIGGAARVEYTAPENAVLEIHSHPTMPARFSAQDDRDEQGLRVYGVIGHLASDRAPELRLRVGVYGYFMDLSWGQVFEGALPADVTDAVALDEQGDFVEMDFDTWYELFQVELSQRCGFLPNGIDKESYREDWKDGLTPTERADQEIYDLVRGG